MRAVPRRTVLLHAGAAAVLAAGCSGTPQRPGPDPTPSEPSARLLNSARFAAAVADDDRYLINVHTRDEGSLPGTDAALPFDQLPERAGELPQDRRTPLALYCRTGVMSAEAVETLAGMGYRDLVELDGGMVAWERDGRRLLPPQPAATEADGSTDGGPA